MPATAAGGVKDLPGRILVARSLDAANLNAQAKNAQNILRRWTSSNYRPTGLSFSTPDAELAANPNVDILQLRGDRLWRLAVVVIYQRSWQAIFYPGIHHWADWLGLWLREATGRRIPVITTIEGLVGDPGDKSRQRWFGEAAGHPVYCQEVAARRVKRIEALYRKADHIIAISPFLARLAKLRYGAKVSMLPLGVDTSLFKRTSFSKRTRPRVVTAGNVRAHKRPQFFLELARVHPDADFFWFGDGDLRPTMRQEIARSGLANVDFPGALPPPELAEQFVSSDIFVLPSRSEGVPKVTQEAAAAGLAQVIFGFYEAPTVIQGQNGLVVWSDDEMVAAVGTLIRDFEMTERLGRAGSAMAASWSWDIVAPQWERRIIDLVEASKK